MTRLEFFENGFAWMAMELGVISTSQYLKWLRYKMYLSFRDEGHDKTTAIQLTADKTKASFSTVWRCVEYFQ